MKHFSYFKAFLTVLLMAVLQWNANAQVSLFAVDDGTAFKAFPDTTASYKGASNIFVYKVDAADEAISFVKFDLTPYKGKILKTAGFSTRSDMNDGKTMTVKLTKSASTNFTRSTLTWNNKPATSDELATVIYDQETPRKFFTLSGTKLVDYINDALLAGRDQIAFGLVYKSGDGADFKWAGGSKDGAYGPQLDLTFDEGRANYLTDDGVAIEINPDSTASSLGATNIYIFQKGANDRAYAYIKFKLTGMANKTIGSVELSTRSSMNTDKTMTVSLRSVATTDWTRNTLKWSNKPAIGSTELATTFLDASSARKPFVPVGTKLVDYINGVLATGNEEIALAIVYKEGDGADFKWMGGKGDGAYGPILKYTEGLVAAAYATADGTAIQAKPDSTANSLGATNIYVRNEAGSETMSFVKFNIGQFAGRKVKSVKFSTRGSMNADKTMTVALLISNATNFTREGLTWNTKPTTGNELATLLMEASSARKYFVQTGTALVDYVNAKLQEGATEIAFAMKYKEGDGADLKWIGGKGDGAYGPMLEFELSYDYSSRGIADAVAFQAFPDSTANYKHKSNIFIYKTDADEAIAFVKFNVSALAGKKISSAIFSTRGAMKTDGKTMTISLMDAASTKFARDTTNWNNKPATGKELATGLVVKSSARQNFTPTGTAFVDFVNGKLAQMQTEIAFALKFKEGDGDEFGWMGGVGDAAYGPFLDFKIEEPVSIDTITVLQDAYVLQEFPDSIGNGIAELQIGKNGTTDKETYLKFSVDKKKYPAGKVTLLLKRAIKDTNPDLLEKFTIQVIGTSNAWKEDTLKWTNKPAANPLVLAEYDITQSAIHQVSTDNLTHYINAAIKAGEKEVSFVIKGKNNSAENKAWISSKEWVAAKMVIDYSVAPPVQEMISIADSYVSQVAEDQAKNYGKEADQHLINDDDNQKSKWNFFKYDISGAYKEPVSAILKIYGSVHSSAAGIESFTYQIFTSDNISWYEDSITWVNKPNANSVVMLEGKLAKTGAWYELGSPEFNSYIKQAVKDGKKYVTLVAKGKDKTPENRAWFSGREWRVSSIKLNYEPQVETPLFNPAVGEYIAEVEVDIRCNTPSSTIYYTTDGTVPTELSTKYTAKIKITETTTIKAIAYSGTLKPSFVAEAKYTVRPVGNPELFPSSLVSYTDDNPPLVTITVVPANAIIYYSDDNGEPLTPYPAGGIQLTKTTTIKAQAYSADGSHSSEVVTANYIVEKTVAGIGVGPGGIGYPDNSISGQPENTLWLKADQINGLNDGDPVTTWEDQSGNNNNATDIYKGTTPANYHKNVEDAPVFVANGVSGNMPAVKLGPIDGREPAIGALAIPDKLNGKDDFDGMGGLSLWVVLKRNTVMNDFAAIVEKRDFFKTSAKNAWVLQYNGGGGPNELSFEVRKEDRLVTTGGAIADNENTYIVGSDLRAFDRLTFWKNGRLAGSLNYAKPINNIDAPLIIGNSAQDNLAEVIFFKKELNQAQKVIIQNYLAAKYEIELTGETESDAKKIYTNNDYKNDVIGVGKALYGTKAESHLASSGGALQLEAVGSTLDAGEFVFAGHNGTDNAEIGPNKIWARSWYVQKSSGSEMDVKIGFDFIKAGLTVPGSTDGYGLYYSADGATYAALTIAPSLSGSVMGFTVPKVADGYYLLSAGPLNGVNTIGSNSQSLMVYPNPAENYTRLDINNHNQGKFTIQLYNATGSLVKTISSNKMNSLHSEKISTADLLPGIYLLHVQQGNESGVIRLLKK
jgi:hypothetical protein